MSFKLKGCDLSVLNLTKALTKNVLEEKKCEHQKLVLHRDHRREIFFINRELREVKTSLREIRAISGYCHETRALHFTAVSTPHQDLNMQDSTVGYPTEVDRENRYDKIQNAGKLDMTLPKQCARGHVPRDWKVTPKLMDVFDGPLGEQTHISLISNESETHMSSEFIDKSLLYLKRTDLNAKKQNDSESGTTSLAKIGHGFVCNKGLSELATKQNMANEDFTKLLLSLSKIEQCKKSQKEHEEEYPAIRMKCPPRSSARKGEDDPTQNELDFQGHRVERGYCREGVFPVAEARCNLYQEDLPSVPLETFKKSLVRNKTARFSSAQNSGTKDSAHVRMSKAAARQTLQLLVQQNSRIRLTSIEKEKQEFLKRRVSKFVRELTVNSENNKK